MDFPPELKFTDGTKLEVISQIKLVGLVISDNLSWHENTLYICRKARTKLWIIRRMKSLSLSHEQIFDVYCKEIRSIVEFGVPVWHPGLTKKDSNDIERVQKVAFKIILESCYTDYTAACLYFNTTTLKLRRKKLCINFATKNLKSEESFFDPVQKTVNTRSEKALVKEYKCRTSRYSNSSLPYLARLLNMKQ